MLTVYILIGLAVFFAVVGVLLMVASKGGGRDQIALRLEGVQQIRDLELGESLAESERKRKEAAEKKKRQRQKDIIKRSAFSEIPALERKLKGSPWAERLAWQLRQAELPITVNAFLLIGLATMALGVCMTVIWKGTFNPVLAPIAAAVFGAAPYVFVRVVVRRKLKSFGLQFPDALDLLSAASRRGCP